MTTIWEETKTQGAKMKGRPLKEKLEYFWEYYKIHTIVAVTVIALIASLVHAWATSKDYALSIVMINSIADSFEGVTDTWTGDLTSILDFDTKEYEVAIDTTVMLGMGSASATQEYSSSQKVAAMVSSQSIDIITADTSIFEQYAQNGFFTDLRDIYTEEQLNALNGQIYYTDMSTASDYDDINDDVISRQAAYNVDHHDPSAMKDPVPVGIFPDESSRLVQSGVYSHLPGFDAYQGHERAPVIGVPLGTPRTDAAIIGIEYLTEAP